MQALNFSPQQRAALPGSKKFPFALRVLTRDADRSEIFALRYRAYRDSTCIPLNPKEQYSDSYDELASTVVIAAYDANVCVGALRVNFSHPWQSVSTMPCAASFADVAKLKASTSGSLVEVSRLSIDPTITNTSYRTTLYASLVRAGFLAAQAANVSSILLATKSDWIKFYQYMLGFKLVGEPAIYPPFDVPLALLAGSFGDAEKRQKSQNAFFKITDGEIASMKAAIASALVMPAAA